jgi:hypothetical protein
MSQPAVAQGSSSEQEGDDEASATAAAQFRNASEVRVDGAKAANHVKDRWSGQQEHFI